MLKVGLLIAIILTIEIMGPKNLKKVNQGLESMYLDRLIPLEQLNKVTQQNSAISEEMASNSEELTGQAEVLKQTISFFRQDEQNIGKI